MHIYIYYNIPLINPIQLPIHSHIKVVSTGCSASGREEDQGNVRVIPREIFGFCMGSEADAVR